MYNNFRKSFSLPSVLVVSVVANASCSSPQTSDATSDVLNESTDVQTMDNTNEIAIIDAVDQRESENSVVDTMDIVSDSAPDVCMCFCNSSEAGLMCRDNNGQSCFPMPPCAIA
jgi:hypothetical protein